MSSKTALAATKPTAFLKSVISSLSKRKDGNFTAKAKDATVEETLWRQTYIKVLHHSKTYDAMKSSTTLIMYSIYGEGTNAFADTLVMACSNYS